MAHGSAYLRSWAKIVGHSADGVAIKGRSHCRSLTSVRPGSRPYVVSLAEALSRCTKTLTLQQKDRRFRAAWGVENLPEDNKHKGPSSLKPTVGTS